MTPKEKAKDLLDSFEFSFAGIISNDEDWEKLAKQCALIAVEELIKEKNKWENGSFYTSNYWDYVKKEIENL